MKIVLIVPSFPWIITVVHDSINHHQQSIAVKLPVNSLYTVDRDAKHVKVKVRSVVLDIHSHTLNTRTSQVNITR